MEALTFRWDEYAGEVTDGAGAWRDIAKSRQQEWEGEDQNPKGGAKQNVLGMK